MVDKLDSGERCLHVENDVILKDQGGDTWILFRCFVIQVKCIDQDESCGVSFAYNGVHLCGQF